MKIGLIVAIAFCIAPLAVSATPLQLTLTGSVVGYSGAQPNDPAFQAALPLGLSVSAQILFDDTILVTNQGQASGTVEVGTVAYTVTGASSNGGIGPFPNGQSYSFFTVSLAGPAIPSDRSDLLPGSVFLDLGVPYPNPLGSAVGDYPYNEIGVAFPFLGGGGLNDLADITLPRASIKGVPEPASAALFAAGLAGLAVVRRNRKPASCRQLARPILSRLPRERLAQGRHGIAREAPAYHDVKSRSFF